MIEYFQSQVPGSIYFFFVVGFVLLIKGADILVDGSASLARRFNISELVIGLTIVSFGTSAPELAVNIVASFGDSPDIAIGNILGSNVANILLILGIAALIYPLSVKSSTVWKEIPYSCLAAIIVGLLVNDVLFGQGSRGLLSQGDGVILLAFFIIFMYYVIGMVKETGELPEEAEPSDMSVLKAVLYTIGGLIALPVGGDWIVTGAKFTATNFGLSKTFISLTIVAIGTSLPEVAASAAAALKKRTDIAIGNAVGSNIFNIFWVLGLSSLIRPIPFKFEFNRDVGVAFGAGVLLLLFLQLGKRHVLTRFQGGIFIVLYVIYMVYLGFNATA